MSNPAGFTFGPDGNFYIASRNTNQILKYDGTTGTFLGVFGSSLTSQPNDITFGSNGNAYVGSSAGFYILNGTTGAIISNVAAGVIFGLAFRPSNGDLLLSDVSSNSIVE